MTAPKRGRVSLAETIAANAKAMAMYAKTAPKPVSEEGRALTVAPIAKEKKPRAESNRPLERDVQKPIIQAIRNHPKVAWLGRMNSGTALSYSTDGSKRFTRFHTIAGLSDTLGQLIDGRLCVFEIKRDEKSKLTPDQALFLDLVKVNNGVAARVWTPEMAIAVLDAA